MNKKTRGFLSVNYLIFANLFLRVCTALYSAFFHRWDFGDTGHYLNTARTVCSGEWGATLGKPPFYSWLLCAFGAYTESPWAIAAVLLVQTMVVWAAGYFVYRRAFGDGGNSGTEGILVIGLFLFDPGIFVFSHSLMSDGLFTAGMLIFAVVFFEILRASTVVRPKKFQGLFLGGLGGCLVLTRSVAYPVLLWSICLATVCFYYKNKKQLQTVVFAVVGFFLVTSPYIYWNATHEGRASVVRQDTMYWVTIAGIVKHSGEGLDFVQSELKWVRENPRAYDKAEIRKAIVENLGTYLKLTAKGVARVLFGHLNVEWGKLLFGKSLIGPAWFKNKDVREGDSVTGVAMIFWALGLAFFFCYSAWFYFYVARGWRWSWFSVWALGVCALMAVAPQVWGDARFRLGFWPVLLVVCLKRGRR